MTQWENFKKPQRELGIDDPKLVCIDIQSNGTTQAAGTATGRDKNRTLNTGGFGDPVFNVVSSFQDSDASRFVREVESVGLKVERE